MLLQNLYRYFLLIGAACFILTAPGSASAAVDAKFTGAKQCSVVYPGSFEKGFSDQCYSCPKGYKRAWWRGIKSPKGCYRSDPKKFSKAKYEGKVACKKGSFEHKLSGNCYACPTGYKRNLNPGNPAKAKVCSIDKKYLYSKYEKSKKSGTRDLNFLHNLAKQGAKIPTATELKTRFGRNDAKPPVGPWGVTQYEADRARIDYMERVLNGFDSHNEKYGTHYQTVTYVKTSGGAVIGGYTKEWGFSMTKNGNDEKECRKLESQVYSLGVQLDADVAEGVGIHQYPIEDIAGDANGFASAFTWFDSAFSWTTAGQPSVGLYWPSLFRSDGSMTIDGGILSSIGGSAAYAHSNTDQSSTPVPCDVLVWGPDFSKVNQYSWVEESK